MGLVSANAIKRERSVSPTEEPLDPDLYVVKYEKPDSPSQLNASLANNDDLKDQSNFVLSP